MLREGFSRLQNIRERKVTLEVDVEDSDKPREIETTIGEIFRTDLAQALLLDTHVNRPALIWQGRQNIWIDSVQGRLKNWDMTQQVSLTTDQELLLIADLLSARLGRMSDPVGRAIDILKYTENQVVEDLARAEEYSGPNPVPAYLDAELNVGEAEGVWASIRSFPHKVLTFTDA